jgi:hypothetical protein
MINFPRFFRFESKQIREQREATIKKGIYTPEESAAIQERVQKNKQDYEEKSKLVREIGMQVAERRKHQISDIKNRIRE